MVSKDSNWVVCQTHLKLRWDVQCSLVGLGGGGTAGQTPWWRLAPVSSRKQQVSSFISETTSLGNPSLPLRACIAYEAAGLSSPIEYPVVGLLSQPC
ncbi:hypothetical protein DY000_02018233 [Brassica cretica]|uniref:Uncharacterized protein n=1 Tax=Brassica cretica TaxID=69181 RepID=A0ABQ7CS92_BRACR|nr:hypothetical protein DY000_02018233 [Brassica cretica]